MREPDAWYGRANVAAIAAARVRGTRVAQAAGAISFDSLWLFDERGGGQGGGRCIALEIRVRA
eukprot:7332264-Lingulodinium_polyedra.AAC.1